jgi:multidrug efflux pump subunit AcrA (membrane-fusion protein)
MATLRYAFLSVLATGVIVLTGASCQRKEAALEKPVQSVRAGVVETVHTDAPALYTATFSPLNEINLAFKTSGLIESILQVRGADGNMRDVQPGDKVAKGDELAVVRRIDYQQKVDSAHEQLRQAQAQLGEAQAALDHAELDYSRSNNLYQNASLIKPEYDRAKAQLDSSRAQVSAAKAAIANAEVGVSEANLSLGDTSLKAPFSVRGRTDQEIRRRRHSAPRKAARHAAARSDRRANFRSAAAGRRKHRLVHGSSL